MSKSECLEYVSNKLHDIITYKIFHLGATYGRLKELKEEVDRMTVDEMVAEANSEEDHDTSRCAGRCEASPCSVVKGA